MTFLRSLRIRWEDVAERDRHPFDVPSIVAIDTIRFASAVTLLVGPNGSGKSTVLEALAVHVGVNAEGGTRNFRTMTRQDSVSELHRHLEVRRSGARPTTSFFLRAESYFNVATAIEAYKAEHSYGGSPHEQSHGESFLALVQHRFTAGGLYLLDEPEAALSIQGQLQLLVAMHDLCRDGSQFVIATHSPVLMAFPGALILELTDAGPVETAWDDVDTVTLTRTFLENPRSFLDHLFED